MSQLLDYRALLDRFQLEPGELNRLIADKHIEPVEVAGRFRFDTAAIAQALKDPDLVATTAEPETPGPPKDASKASPRRSIPCGKVAFSGVSSRD